MAEGFLQRMVKAARSNGGRKSVSPTSTAGQDGVVAYGGYLTNNERSVNLQGQNRYRTYGDMLANTTIVAAGTRYFLNILGKSAWSVEPAQNSDGDPLPGAQEVADLVESCMTDMLTPWSKVIRRAAMHRFFGFSIQEWTAKRRTQDGKIGILAVDPRPQATIERWDLDPTGRVLGAFQRVELQAGELYLPRSKIIHVVDDTLNSSPEGLGVFRHLVRAAERLKVYEELEQVAFETDLRGIPIGRAPLKSLRDAQDAGVLSAASINKLLKPLERFMAGHIRNEQSGVMLDSKTYTTDDEKNAPSAVKEWDLELLQGQSTSQEAVAKAIQRLNSEMSIVLGTEHLLLGSDGTGSLALGTMKVKDFYTTVGAVQNDIKEAYNNDFVGPICDLNGVAEELRPKLKTEDVQFKDVAMMATALQDMAMAGATMTPDDPAIGEMRDLLGLSRVPQDVIDRTMQEGALKTGAELDALNAKANQALGKTPPGSQPPAKGAKK